MAAQPQPIPKFAPTVVAPNGHLFPLAEVPTPRPSPHNSTHTGPPPPPSLPNKDKALPPTPPTSNTGRSSPNFSGTAATNPFETDPSRLPPDDPFRDLPHYGRYAPSPADFQPSAAHIMSTTPASIRYWEHVLTTRCNADTLMLSPVDAEPSPSENGNSNTAGSSSSSSVALGRWIFAVGGCIVKTNHLAPPTRRRRDYSRVDANEVAALALVRKHVVDVADDTGNPNDGLRVPRVYFAGKLLGGDVLVQERLPGVSLEVAWRYLDGAAKRAARRRVRAFARALAGRVVREDGTEGKRAYVVDDYGAIWARALTPRERRLMLPPPPPSSQQQQQQKQQQQKAKSFAAGARAGIGWGNGGGGVENGAAPAGKRKDSGFNDDDDDDDDDTTSPRFQTRLGSNNVFLDDDDDDDGSPYSLDRPDSDTRFAHNDLSTSNIIVDRDDRATGGIRVVGVVDWEHAGWIGWRTTAAVHRELRAPLPDMYDRTEFETEGEWEDFFMWKGLYDDDDDGEGEGDGGEF